MDTVVFAYVIPFCKKDFHEVQFNLNLWSGVGHKPLIGQNTNKINIDLVFYFSDFTTDEVKKIIKPLTVPFKNLFRKTVYQEKPLKPIHNTYPVAAGIMFFDFMIYTNYSVCFYAEADCLPCKDNWFPNLINMMTTCFNQKDWIYGSMFRGLNIINRTDLVRKLHFNGNGIYNCGSGEFKEFLKTARKNIVLKKPYDTEIMRYVLGSPDSIFNNFFTHVKYVDFVINYGKKSITCYLKDVPSRTYFIHGREYQKSLF